MDPQANLDELLNLLDQPQTKVDRDRVVELLEALAAWISAGGFLPISKRVAK